MTYFLDFDKTLFDTDRFVSFLEQSGWHRGDLSLVEFGSVLNEHILSGTLKFALGELTQFLYADAIEFLHRHARDCVIITSGNRDLQKAKVVSAIHQTRVMEIICTGAEKKSETLRRKNIHSGPHKFVDDVLAELDAVAAACPNFHCYEMRRDGGASIGQHPVIYSMSEMLR